MGVDATAVARTLGIETAYKDLRGGNVLYLPQRVMVIAQGSSDVVYSTTKFKALDAAMVGAKMGYGSPAHLALRELKPLNGDGGVGSVEITVYPLVDAVGAAAASGQIAASGTQLKAGVYRVAVNNILSQPFVIPKDANATTALRLLGQAIDAVLEMPVKKTYTYGAVSAAALVGTGNGTIGSLAVSSGGKPVPGVYALTLVTAVGNGGVWKLVDPNGATLTSSLTQTIGVGAATEFTNAGGSGIDFTITDGTTDFGVGATFSITVPATAAPLTAKWKGESGNDLYISIIGDDLGITFAITQPSGGLANPSVAPAIAQVGSAWETLGLCALNISDTTALDAVQSFGEGRWGVLSYKPMVMFWGNTKTTYADATAISGARRTDRVNAQLVAPGSKDLPFVVAARQLAEIARTATNDPASDYAAGSATRLTPGADGEQWDYSTRDLAVKTGSSTIEVIDGVIKLSDIVTFYRPTGEEPPAYRYVRDIVVIQNILWNIFLEFNGDAWRGKPLVPDTQAVSNKNARKPKQAKARLAKMTDSMGLEAWISDPDFAKSSITSDISTQNAKRLNLGETFKISGVTGIISFDFNWGFYFGVAQAA